MKIIAGTGHRPSRIGGFILPNPTYIKICQQVHSFLVQEKPDKIITGMALGFDMWLANIAIKLNIPYIAAIPFIGQDSVWNTESRKIYKILLSKAAEVVVVSEGGYSAEKLQIRNEWMVDRCDTLLAVFDGSPSGTGNCIKYAKEKNKNIVMIDPNLDK